MGKNSSKFFVENVNLTVCYYREYFGFKLIESTQEKTNMQIESFPLVLV
jgi:hypothetical protein